MQNFSLLILATHSSIASPRLSATYLLVTWVLVHPAAGLMNHEQILSLLHPVVIGASTVLLFERNNLLAGP
eukprot:232130-Prorocentrum_lima.AAC.1